MDSREPAGWEGEKGKSAEPLSRARLGGGAAGNTRGTVRGAPAGALSAYRNTTSFRTCMAVGRGVSLPTFYFGLPDRPFGIANLSEKRKYGGHHHEVRAFTGFHRGNDHPVP